MWELIYKEGATLKGDDPETLARTPGTPLPPHSLTHFSLLHHGGNSRVTVTPALSSLKMFLLLWFQGVSPVCHLYSQRIACLSCALILGSSCGFLMGLVYVGGTPPPPPPLPGTLFLCGVVACNYHPLCWTTRYEIWDGCSYWCFKGVDR